MARIQGVDARICTWELVTGFEESLAPENLLEYFRRDFPEVEGIPKFWKMGSFNSPEGRRHRYLVILGSPGESDGSVKGFGKRCWRGRRALPRSLFLYARADAQMESWESYENFRYAAIVNGTLYVLVFYEGRLCHWSEERGYEGACGKELALNRLVRMDEFLRQDPLFSKAENFRQGELEFLEVDFGDPAAVWVVQLGKAAKDPFWKGLHLESRKRGRAARLSLILFFLMMFAGILVRENLDAGGVAMPGPEAPVLSTPATGPISKEPRIQKTAKSSRPKAREAATECPRPSISVQGIVGDRLFSGVFAGARVVKRAGDSLESYRVKSVLRDRVVLECGGREWEVLNGAP